MLHYFCVIQMTQSFPQIFNQKQVFVILFLAEAKYDLIAIKLDRTLELTRCCS